MGGLLRKIGKGISSSSPMLSLPPEEPKLQSNLGSCDLLSPSSEILGKKEKGKCYINEKDKLLRLFSAIEKQEKSFLYKPEARFQKSRHCNDVLSIECSDKEIDGTLPDHLELLEDCTILDLSHNNLEGLIPNSICKIANLISLYNLCPSNLIETYLTTNSNPCFTQNTAI